MGVSISYILDEMTYENVIMYSRAAPSYDTEDDNWDYSVDECEKEPTGEIGDEENVY